MKVGYYFGPVHRVEVLAVAKGYAMVRKKGCMVQAVGLAELGQMVWGYVYSPTPKLKEEK